MKKIKAAGIIQCLSACILLACAGVSEKPEKQRNNFHAAYQPFTGHSLKRLRGAYPDDREFGLTKNMEDLRALGANHIRWHMSCDYDSNVKQIMSSRDSYYSWLGRELTRTEKAAQLCEKLGMLMVVDLASPYGNRDSDNIFLMCKEKKYADEFVETWDVITRRLMDCKAIYAFEPVNEPVFKYPVDMEPWIDLFIRAAERIREIDPGRALVFEPAPWAASYGYTRLKEPIPLDNIIYSFHMYTPSGFSHQFRSEVPAEYPGIAATGYYEQILYGSGKPEFYNVDLYWDKEALKRAVNPVLEFQRKYNVAIYVGEFSATRWAPKNSTYRYLKDCIEIFEEYGWDWAYHAWRESNIWDLELSTNMNNYVRSEEPTDRELLLESYFRKNEYPEWN